MPLDKGKFQGELNITDSKNVIQPGSATLANQKRQLRTFSIEKVSWLEQIFEMLAHSALQGIKSDNENNVNYSIHIADTLVFHYQRPAALYYMEDGVLRSSNDSADLAVSALLARFTSRSGSCKASESIVAIYAYGERQSELPDTQQVVVEYLNLQQLDHFLRHRGKENDGILQKFMPSCGTFQTSIRVFWTSRRCDVEVYSSVHRRDEHKARSLNPQVEPIQAERELNVGRTYHRHFPPHELSKPFIARRRGKNAPKEIGSGFAVALG